ncbi:PDR/VanB family oxidoreductase [Streptomyces sp. NPDC101194]|uniref:PDR/VanB family oxidoreductase n=1 Tax=Streptomyces sp. NPDC101194 TaxID=3366127 RepID=UPI00382CBD51
MTGVRDAAAPPGTRVLEVREAETVADGVLSLTLADPSGAPLPPWTPGAHVDLHVAPGLVRQYSLCSDPQDTGHYRIAVLRVPDGRGGSAAVHETLRAGGRVAVSAPRNHFELVDAPEYLLVAGGIGITPLLAMARRLTAVGKPWRMLYGGRSRATMAFLGELPADRVTVVPQDEAGHPDLAGYLAAAPAATVYACGPGGLLDAVRELHPGPVHTERFTAPDPAGNPEVDHAFDVRLARSGLDVRVPADTSVLDAVRAAGAEVPSSCEAGICGTCETRVIDGDPDHRDTLLTPEEQQTGTTMMICVSRCRGTRLVLDL